MFKPEMVDCLEFLRKCYKERVLDPECFEQISNADMRSKIATGLYGGTMDWSSWSLSAELQLKELVPEAYLENIGALSHIIDKNLNHYSIGVGAPRVMMKTTPQPRETINWYVNTFYGDD